MGKPEARNGRLLRTGCGSARESLTIPRPLGTPPAKDRPVKAIRTTNIRANRLEGGGDIYNTTIDRLWKEEGETDGSGRVVKGGRCQKSEPFGKDDLLLVAKIAELAHTWD